MGIYDNVLCNNLLFGKHRCETHQTTSLDPAFPEDTFEITPMGRMELPEVTFQDRSDPNAQGRSVGIVMPVFTGNRQDLSYHGWLELTSFGLAMFTDGMMVAFDPDPESKEHCTIAF